MVRSCKTASFSALLLAAACFLSPSPAPAVTADLNILQNSDGEKVVQDSANGFLWYWDLSLFASKNYTQQIGQIELLNGGTYFERTGWHMATDAEMQTLWSLDSQVIRQTFHPTHERYEGSYEWHYWGGRYGGTVYGDEHMAVQTAWGNFVFGPFDYPWPEVYYVIDSAGGLETGAWVVTVPEPGAAALLLLGLAVLRSSRRTRAGQPVV